jgi:EAL domain-containing protein (putative c-di-GMP-specific phosphodiesterase class I)
MISVLGMRRSHAAEHYRRYHHIDRSFITRLWPDDLGMVVVQGLIYILRNLDIRVVVEGIEAEVQASRFGQWAVT